MATTNVVVGNLGKTYYLSTARTSWGTTTAGLTTGTAPTSMIEISAIRNVQANQASKVADVTSRASDYQLGAPALFVLDITFDIPWTPSDGGFVALRNAFVGRTNIALAVLDGSSATSGSQGWWADFMVTDFPREEPIDNAMLCKVKVEPVLIPSGVKPQYVVCS